MTTDPEPPILLADIGGTNARFGLCGPDGIGQVRILRGADFPTLDAAARAYLDEVAPAAAPRVAAIAVAGPVTGDVFAMTNLPWTFSISAVRQQLGLERLQVVNDFTAVAMSVPHLGPDDRLQVGEGEPEPNAVIGVLGPGSGLGVSGLVPGPNGWTALSGEGGHVTMPAISDREGAVLAFLRKRYDHVSAERVLSGMGIVNLYEAVSVLDGQEPETMTPAQITQAAIARQSPACEEAAEMFCAMLGTIAGNLALTLGARGGVYVAGGIVPKLGPFFVHSRFRKRFVEKGRMRDYLGPIPTYVVTNPLPAFVGLRAIVSRPT